MLDQEQVLSMSMELISTQAAAQAVCWWPLPIGHVLAWHDCEGHTATFMLMQSHTMNAGTYLWQVISMTRIRRY